MHTDELHYLTGFRSFVGRDSRSLQDFGEMLFVFSVVAAAKMPDLWQHFKRCEPLLQSFRQVCEQVLDFIPGQGISVQELPVPPADRWMDGWKV